MTVKDLKLAIDKLRAGDPSAGLPGREKHIRDVELFLTERLRIRKTEQEKKEKVRAGLVADIQRHSNKTMFVCGVPGTGKTAVVMSVVDRLFKQQTSKKKTGLHPFKYYYINGQHITESSRVYSEIYRQIYGKQCNPENAQTQLDKIFGPTQRIGRRACVSPTNQFYVVIIDELDLLYSERRQSTFYTLFDWPTSTESRLILITIANAMDLPDRFMRGRISSRVGWDKLIFEPYNNQHLMTILESRLGKSLMDKCFESKALVVASQRIGKSTGDARRIIDTCLQALEEAASRGANTVTATIMDRVGFQIADKTKVETLNLLPLIDLIALKAILKETQSKGEDNVYGIGVYEQMVAFLKLYSPKSKKQNDATLWFRGHVLSADEFFYALSELNAYKFITLQTEHTIFEKRVYLRDSSDIFRDAIENAKIDHYLADIDLEKIKDRIETE